MDYLDKNDIYNQVHLIHYNDRLERKQIILTYKSLEIKKTTNQ